MTGDDDATPGRTGTASAAWEAGQWEPGQWEPGLWEPGQWVRHPGEPGWGVGQVQSAVGHRVTVMFEDAGKVLVDTRIVPLRLLDGPDSA